MEIPMGGDANWRRHPALWEGVPVTPARPRGAKFAGTREQTTTARDVE
ncbi:MAG: hypothetical protein ACTSU5_17895 [Promethearchaeota archaeon]